jgi:hypothetical protein
MTAVSHGDMTTAFLSNALNGGAVKGKKVIANSTVVRIALQSGAGQPPKVLSQQVVADKIPWIDDSAALGAKKGRGGARLIALRGPSVVAVLVILRVFHHPAYRTSTKMLIPRII